ncbi:hypothetical protein Tco_1422450 [Tanacetum coccineum]
MNQEQIRQVARDEALVPIADRVTISSTNMRIDPSLTQREDTFQFILDIIKASPCYNVFLITADVPEIYMQQFWFIVKNIKKTTFYEFSVGDKKCKIDVELFRKILDTMLTDEIKQSKAYKSFVAYSTGMIPPKKSKGKSISRIGAEIAEEARRVHETRKRLVTEKPVRKEDSDESEGEAANRPTRRRRPSGVVFTDTLRVLDESIDKLTTSSEGAGITPEVPDEVKGNDQDDNDDRSIVIEETDDEEKITLEDEYGGYEARDDKYVHDGADEEMKDAENDETGKDDDEMADADKADVEMVEESKGYEE